MKTIAFLQNQWLKNPAQAARRRLRLERDGMPLLSGQIAAVQESPEERIARMDDSTEKWWRGIRRYRAKVLWKIRRVLASLPTETVNGLAAEWAKRKWTRDPVYLADFLWHRCRDELTRGEEHEPPRRQEREE